MKNRELDIAQQAKLNTENSLQESSRQMRILRDTNDCLQSSLNTVQTAFNEKTQVPVQALVKEHLELVWSKAEERPPNMLDCLVSLFDFD